jgi:hypothetical protein
MQRKPNPVERAMVAGWPHFAAAVKSIVFICLVAAAIVFVVTHWNGPAASPGFNCSYNTSACADAS